MWESNNKRRIFPKKDRAMLKDRKCLFSPTWLLVVCIVSGVMPSVVNGEPPITVETVKQAWKIRQERVRTLRFRWIDRETTGKGSISRLYAMAGFKAHDYEEIGLRPGAVVPPEDSTSEISCYGCMDKEKMRVERDNREWAPRENSFVTLPIVSTFDGDRGTCLWTKGGIGIPHPQAHISPGSRGHTQGGALATLILAYRPFSKQVCSIETEALKLTGRKVVIEGRTCHELEYESRGNLKSIITVDPAMDYSIVSVRTIIEGNLRGRRNIQYRRDAKGEWVPIRWDVSSFSYDGKLDLSIHATVTLAEINPEVGPKEFVVEFPPGTRVSDESNPQVWNEYILKEDGRKRAIDRGEIGANREQLLSTETGEAWGNKTSIQYWGVILPVVICGIAATWLIGRIIWRRRRLRSEGTG
jgi:hypothetical protein